MECFEAATTDEEAALLLAHDPILLLLEIEIQNFTSFPDALFGVTDLACLRDDLLQIPLVLEDGFAGVLDIFTDNAQLALNILVDHVCALGENRRLIAPDEGKRKE